ncbi:MAG: hypothetical protein EBS18_01290 [Actinobacteria bacterium]|nr:hypothetical protein [Actinomycetota bacterium]
MRALVKHPVLFGVLITLFISLLYSRNRLGSLSGGALAVAPNSATELLHRYVDSWHLVGVGSSASVPTWVPVVAIASFITLGNPQLFISTLFLLTPTIAFFVFYRSSIRFSLAKYSAFIASLLYAFSPVVLTAINQGRLGTIVIALILPLLFTLLPKNLRIENLSLRRTAAICLIAGVAMAFSPLFAIAWLLLNLILFIQQYISDSNSWRTRSLQHLLENLDKSQFKKRAGFIFAPILMNIPWAFNFVFHPLKGLLEPGLSVESSGPLSILLFNPGGPTAPRLILIAPFALFLLISLITQQHRDFAIFGIVTIAFAAALSTYYVVGNGSSAQRIWTGPLIIFAQILALLCAFSLFEKLLPILRSTNLGYRHFLSLLTAVISAVSLIIMPFWAATVGANSLVRANQELVIPAFITDLASTPAKPKTLVIRKSVSGVGTNSGQILGYYGVQFVFMKNPADPSLVRTIDGIGGFTRSSATKDGVVWKVNDAHARLTLVDQSGQSFALASNDKSSNAYAAKAGTILLAEKYDKSWKLLLDGRIVKISKNQFGQPAFKIDKPGELLLVHDGTSRRGWVSLQLISIITLVVLTLPAGRRRKEVPLEELA